MASLGRLSLCPSGKLVYATEQAANEAARRLLRVATYRVYRCHECPWWHLTRKPYDPRKH